MFKWVAGLCAVMYFTLLVFGEPPEGEEQVVAVEALQQSEATAAIVDETTAQIDPVDEPETPLVVAASAPAPTPKIVTESLAPATEVETIVVSTAGIQPEATPQPAALIETTPTVVADGIGEIWKVSGSTVNLRAGATTQAAVLGRTQRGDSAEVMELLDNGWAKVYILESGLEAYMAAKFLIREGQ